MSRFKVLLVDDEDELVFTVVERLKLRDIDATGVTSGPQALNLLQVDKYDVVVVDVKMPEMGGVECLRRMREQQPDIQVILLTGHGSQKERDDGLAEGAFDYLMKPVKLDALIEKMQAAVDARKEK